MEEQVKPLSDIRTQRFREIILRNEESYKELSSDEFNKFFNCLKINPLLLDNDYLMDNPWSMFYKRRPPTIHEFLTPKWIGPTGLMIYDHVRETLGTFWDSQSPYRHLILASAIGWGKSFSSTISALYIMSRFSLMKSPKDFFGLSEATSIVISLISFSLKKAEQILLQPFFQILKSSSMFKRIMRQEKLEEKQQNEYADKICWTTAGRIGSIQFANDLHIIIASDPAHILGLTLICSILSEISFFIERGISPEMIWRIYNDSKGRVFSRFEHKYFATTILDSSPNDMELSPIDKYIFTGKAQKDPLNYVITSTHWDVFPEKYPEHQKTGETFLVFRGSGTKPPRIVENESQLKNYGVEEVYKVPIDIKQMFIDNLKKSVKDYCGYPGGSTAKLFDNFDVIENIFSIQLKSVYTSLYAPASSNPENLIWNQIKDDFFIQLAPNKYTFYRNPTEKRYIHCDLAESNDVAGIGIVHPELNTKGDMIIVVDFGIVIIPKNDKINLDAVFYFIEDLHNLGGFDIGKITFDMWQSSALIQRLKRLDYEVDRFSVDKDKNPYYVLASWIKNGRVKSGRNIFLKNNLKSLQEITTDKGKKKIDHVIVQSTVYDDGGDWETSLMGLGAKDLSDSICGATTHCINEYKGVPNYIWDNKITTVKKINKNIEKEIAKSIYDKYSLTVDEVNS